MEKKVEAKTQVNPEKKSKTRMLLVLLFLVVVAIIGYIALRGQYLELLEIGENYTSVFWQNLTYKSVAFVISFVILFIIIYLTNKGIKKELKPFFDAEKRQVPKLLNKSLALVVSIIGSAIIMNVFTENAMLFVNSTQFGIGDPIFSLDIGYFIFQKPFIEMILMLLISITICVLIYSVIYYIVTFNVCFDGIDRNTLKQSNLVNKIFKYIKIVVVFLGVYIIFKTQDLGIDQSVTLQDDDSTRIYGAGLTSVTIKLWGYIIFAILMVVAVFKAIKFFKEKKTRKVVISLVTIPGYLLALFLVMTIFQFAFVKPNELDREKQYIEANIRNTRTAYNINVQENELDSSEYNNLDVVNDNSETVNNTAIVSQDITLDTLNDNQTSSNYYSYSNSQIGKYNINGNDELVYLSPRQIESKNNTSYNNKTYEYTHGYGTVITSATETDETGNMEYIQKSFDGSDNQINVTQPRIYFGLDENTPIVTNSKDKSEFDYPKSDTETAQNTYDGSAGLTTNFLDRLVLGIREKNLNITFSSSITNESKILLNRNILERVEKVFPYVIYDENPYQVITSDGRIVWVIDGYTTASNYPYSQMSVIERNGTRERLNYIRNSVKVIVDSYNGTVNFYITDTTDPIIMAYKEIYPELFKTKEEIPQDIAEHFVYPEFLYNIQADMLERYHNVKADVLYRSSDVWDRATHTTGQTLRTTGTPIDPYYTMVKTVDSEESQLGLVLPYTLDERQSLISYLVGTYDNNGNSKLTLYKYAVDSNIIGPMQLDTQIEQDEEISSTLQNLNVTGTRLIRNMIMVPIDNTILYVEPIYQVMLNESEVPVLRRVIVAVGNKVAIGNNLTEALRNLGSQSAINIEVSNTDDINSIIDEIIKANKNVENSTRNNDWDMVGSDMSTLQSLINRLDELVTEQRKQEEEENADNTVTDANTTVDDPSLVDMQAVNEIE